MESFRHILALIFICGASIAVNNDVNLKLWKAAGSGDEPAVVSALDEGGDSSWPNPSDQHDRTALMIAASGNHADITRIMIEAGADIEKRDAFSGTAMHHAAYKGSNDAVSVLISHKADVNSLTKAGETPLMLAALGGGNLATTKILVDAGASVDIAANSGNTALHVAALWNKAEIARYLLQKGADAKKRNNEGQTPADAARAEGNHQLADIIDNFTPVSETTPPTATLTAQPTAAPTFLSQHGLLIIAAVCGTIITISVCIFLGLRYRLSLRQRDQGHNEDVGQPPQQDSRVELREHIHFVNNANEQTVHIYDIIQ